MTDRKKTPSNFLKLPNNALVTILLIHVAFFCRKEPPSNTLVTI